MVQKVNQIRRLEEERRIKRRSLVKYLINYFRDASFELNNLQTLLEFPANAIDFNESNNYLKHKLEHIFNSCFEYTGFDPLCTSSIELEKTLRFH